MGKNGTLSPSQSRAIGALLAERSAPAAATAAKVPVRTLYRWLEDPAFRAALATAEGALIDSAVRRLLALQSAALDALAAVLADADASPSVRVAAAGRVLDALLKLRELRSVEERITALEQAYGGEL